MLLLVYLYNHKKKHNIIKMNKIILVIKFIVKKYLLLDNFISYHGLLRFINFIKNFFFNLLFRLYILLFIILPILLFIKVLYSYFYLSNVDIIYLGQEFISNIPFVGEYWLTGLSKERLLISKSLLIKNQHVSELMFVGGLGSAVG